MIFCRIFTARTRIIKNKMSTFVSQINRITGKFEWILRDDDYDFQQEIARSSYADMLHDTERNQLYYKALEKSINKLRAENKPVNVLDIGTGTGLLSLMAARLGADTVHACEAFKPMAECAVKIIEENGYKDKIKVIPKRSTEVQVGEGSDMPHRANILVTEVFDTELIGEGAIGTFTHAHEHLLEKDCYVVPSVGHVYIQLVTSDTVRSWNQIDDIVIDKDRRITAPDSISRCGGAPSLHDLQLDQLPVDKFTPLTQPLKVMRFDFSGSQPLLFDDVSVVECEMLAPGTVDGIFLWWDLEMDDSAEIILSCAPRWAHPTPDNMQWRDHWMQAIYYPYNQQTVAKGDNVKVICKHDEYSLWFDVVKEVSEAMLQEDQPVCSCMTHITFSRSRMGMLNDPERKQTYLKVLKQHITEDTSCLCISDGSLLPLMAATLGAKHVYTVEENPLCSRVVKKFIQNNNLEEKVTVLESMSELQDQVDLVLGEPIFQTSLLPWDNICYWYHLQALAHVITNKTCVLPGTMTIFGVAVDYKDLWKIRADVGDCEGFDIQQFDKLMQLTSDKVDENVEPQPLWEYPCRAAGEAQTLLSLNVETSLKENSTTVQTNSCLPVKSIQCCNGVALWAEFDFGNGHVISSGPKQPIRLGHYIDWDYYTRQGVHLFYNNSWSSTADQKDTAVYVGVTFKPENGELNFKFSPKWS